MAITRDRLEEPATAEGAAHHREAAPLEDAWMASGATVAPPDGAVATGSRAPLTDRLGEPISGRWAAIAALAWIVLLAVGVAVEPPPSSPAVVDPWVADAAGTVLLVALGTAMVGFWLRRRWSLAVSLLAAGLLLGSTVLCPLSGHHAAVGAWWVVQLGCGLGLVATSAVGLRRA